MKVGGEEENGRVECIDRKVRTEDNKKAQVDGNREGGGSGRKGVQVER